MRLTAQAVTISLFGVAITTYAIRTHIRLRRVKRFMTDDVLLLLAVVGLAAYTGLDLYLMSDLYNALDPRSSSIGSTLLVEQHVALMLSWLTLYLVKLAFLLFFRRLMDRTQNRKTWWRSVVVFTILAGATCVATSWFACPMANSTSFPCRYLSLRGGFQTLILDLACSIIHSDNEKLLLTGIATALDIITDLMVISIPVTFLWRVRIKLRMKLGICVSLCLSVIMIAVVIVRMARVPLADDPQIYLVWSAFWQQQESSIAVIVISVSAFRSFFVASSNHSPPKNRQALGARIVPGHKHVDSIDSSACSNFELPQIPEATLFGMRTFIDTAGSTVDESCRVGNEYRHGAFLMEP